MAFSSAPIRQTISGHRVGGWAPEGSLVLAPNPLENGWWSAVLDKGNGSLLPPTSPLLRGFGQFSFGRILYSLVPNKAVFGREEFGQ